jgi:ribose 5-phosphate isomerase RpiB
MKIVLASDHGGFALKEIIKKSLLQAGREILPILPIEQYRAC